MSEQSEGMSAEDKKRIIKMADITLEKSKKGISLVRKGSEDTILVFTGMNVLIDSHMSCPCANTIKTIALAIYAQGYEHGASAKSASKLFNLPVAQDDDSGEEG